MIVMGIETSCDETGVAIYQTGNGLLSDALHSQISLHAEYGGVVPELASRDHVRKIGHLIKEALRAADLERTDLDGIAYTSGPGLAGALLVGAAVGRSMAWSLGIPAVAVHHMEGHLLAPMLEDQPPELPFVALLVSGGHTQLVDVQEVGHYRLLGQTLDDAAGEAFDKTAKLLGLPYPGGPALAKLAETGDSAAMRFPRPMTDRPGLDFSFSGLKTFTLNAWQKSDQSETAKADIAACFQHAVVETLEIKCRRAMKATGHKRLIIAGGVGANQRLRERLAESGKANGYEVFYPKPKFCTDNGAMIAYAGALRLEAGESQDLSINVRPRWPMDELSSPGG